MSFVDDVRPTFDARHFCNTIKAVVGDNRPTSAALQDADLVKTAETAMETFLDHAHSHDPPDVVAAYLDCSPSASELFSSLYLSSSPLTAITVAALRCLTSIAHYAHSSKQATPPVQAARAVAKDVVKARAAALYDVFLNRRSKCQRNALKLLTTVAGVHPLLAKELINRFDLTSTHFAPTLANHDLFIIRIHFMSLIESLLSVRDFDVVKYFSTKGRPVIFACAEIISKRVQLEIDFELDEELQQSIAIAPAHVQKRDLKTYEGFLRAIKRAYTVSSKSSSEASEIKTQRKSLNGTPPAVVRRSLFGHSLLTALLTVGTAPSPSISIVPTSVRPEHDALRQAATRLFVSIAGDLAIQPDVIASALAAANARPGREVKALSLFLVQQHPRLSSSILKHSRTLCGDPPSLSSQWMSGAAVIASALARCPVAVPELRTHLLEPAIRHDAYLIRHVGATLILAMSRLVERDSKARRTPQRFLPQFREIQAYAKSMPADDLIAHKLLAVYQRLFEPDDEADEMNRDIVRIALQISNSDYAAAEEAIRYELDTSPRDALLKITSRKYLSGMILQASRSKHKSEREMLWELAAYATKKAQLFPQGSLHDVDILFAVLSSYNGKTLEICTRLFEDILSRAVSLPYGLFDELYGASSDVPITTPGASLLIAACFIRLRNLHTSAKSGEVKKGSSEPSNLPQLDQSTERAFLTEALLLHVAFEEVMNGHVSKSSYLTQKLPSVLDAHRLWWANGQKQNKSKNDIPTRPLACDLVSEFLCQGRQYPSQPYLQAAHVASQYRKALRMQDQSHADMVDIGAMWDAVQAWRKDEVEYNPAADAGVVLYRGSPEKGLFQWNDQAGLLLESVGLHPSNMTAGEEVERLRKRLNAADFTVVMCIILTSVSNSKTWHAALQCMLEDISKDLQSEKEVAESEKPLSRFRQHCLISALKRCRTLDDSAFERVFAILNLPCNEKLRKRDIDQWQYEKLLFLLRLLHTAVFHSQDSTSARARFLLSVKSTFKVPKLNSMSPEVARLFAQTLPHSPSQRHSVFRQMSRWNVEGKQLHMNPEVIYVIGTALSFPAVVVNDNENSQLCHWLLLGVSLRDPLVDSTLTRNDFINDETIGNFVLRLGSWSNIKAFEIAHVFRDSNISELTASLGKGIPVLLFWMFVSIRSGCTIFNKHITKFSPTNHSDVIRFINKYLEQNEIDPKNQLFSVLFTLLREFTLAYKTGIHSLKQEVGATLKQTFRRLSQTVGDWVLCENEADSKTGKETKNGCDNEVANRKRKHWSLKTDGHVFEAMFHCLAPIIEVCPGLTSSDYAHLLECLNKQEWSFLQRRLSGGGQDDRFATMQNADTEQKRTKDERFVICVCELVALLLGRSRESNWTKTLAEQSRGILSGSLIALRKVLSEVAEYRASLSVYDLAMKSALRAIDAFFRREGSLINVFPMGSRMFHPDAAAVLASLDHGMLENARDNVFLWNNKDSVTREYASPSDALALLWRVNSATETIVDNDIAQNNHNTNRGSDSEFVLRVLLAACMQAKAAPGTAVLDIGNVVKDGALAVALTALSAPSREARALGYACLQLFSEIVGPVSGVEADKAAGLYRDRKQLAFLLALLRNSVTAARRRRHHQRGVSGANDGNGASNNDSYIRLLPLCMAWFISCMRVALQPGHDANKIVVALLLREPRIDVTTDCAGLFHLFSCRGITKEVTLSRMMALDILQRGTRCAADVVVVRRRKMLDTLFMLAGPLNGIDDIDSDIATPSTSTVPTTSGSSVSTLSHTVGTPSSSTGPTVRIKALSVLDTLLRRQSSLGLADELCQMYGLVPWLCTGDAYETTHSTSGAVVVHSSEIAVRKLSLLSRIMECGGVASRDGTSSSPSSSVVCLQDAFALIVRRAWHSSSSLHMHYTQFVTSSAADGGLHFRSSPSSMRMATAALGKLADATLRGARALVKCDRWRVAPLEFDVLQCVSYYCYSSFRRGRGQNDVLMLLQQSDFASLVARQRNVSAVPTHVVCSVMSARITTTVESVPVPWSDVLVMDCFVVRFVAYQLEKTKNAQQQQRQGQTTSLTTTDEDAISTQPEWIVKIIPRLVAILLQTPTVWTVVAALGVLLSAHKREGLKTHDDIEQIASRVPGDVPNFVCEDMARRFDKVVKDVSHDLIKALLCIA